ncbi:MAG: sigma 54-interacting transcriptional regulator, partial [Pirellula sp.]
EEEVSVDVRILSATHQDLELAMEQKTFRSDLYYRLRGIELRVPALRSRVEDILLLAKRWLSADQQLTPECMAAMMSYGWPGNVRELKQRVEGAAAMATTLSINAQDLGILPKHQEPSDVQFFEEYFQMPLTEAKQAIIERFEQLAIERAMTLENNNVSAAARRLGIHRQNLQLKLKDK